MTIPDRFSERHGFGEVQPAEIRIRLEAPSELRGIVLGLVYECGMLPSSLREIICRVLRKRSDSGNWSERPNIAGENEQLIDACLWYEVYDVIEGLVSDFQKSGLHTPRGVPAAEYFEDQLNRYFLHEGIGWRLSNGVVEYRGSEPFEEATKQARTDLSAKGMTTASGEMHQAFANLSKRPDADVTGAIQHSLAALECLVREITGYPRATLGTLLKRNPGLLPKPVDEICKKAWGFASEFGRHLREGRVPDIREVELMVGLSSILCSYLARKHSQG